MDELPPEELMAEDEDRTLLTEERELLAEEATLEFLDEDPPLEFLEEDPPLETGLDDAKGAQFAKHIGKFGQVVCPAGQEPPVNGPRQLGRLQQ